MTTIENATLDTYKKIAERIEIKNLKIIDSMSDDSICFTATVYVDGKRAFMASDRGNGGGMDFGPITKAGISAEDYRTARTAAEEVRAEVNDWCLRNIEPFDTEHGMPLDVDLEIAIGMLIERESYAKELRRALKKIVIRTTDARILSFKAAFDPRYKPSIEKQHPGCAFLNELPFDDALALFIDALERAA